MRITPTWPPLGAGATSSTGMVTFVTAPAAAAALTWTGAFYWRCRFLLPENAGATHEQLIALMGRVHAAGLDFIKTENLYTFDGEAGYSLGQGQ